MKTKINVILGLLVGSLFIWLAFRGTDIEGIKSSFKAANYLYLIPIVFLTIIILMLRSYRWGVILEPLEKIDQWSLFSITAVGFMAIVLLPVRMGELARPYLISQKSTIKMGSSLATVVVERIFDMLTLLMVLLLILMMVKLPAWIFRSVCSILLIVIPLFLVLIFLAVKREVSVKSIDRIIGKLPKTLSSRLMRSLHSFLDGLQILPDLKKTFYLASLSLLIWSLVGLSTYILFLSFESMLGLSLAAAYVVLVITALGVTLPTAPGFIGNYHFSCVLALSLFGIPKTDALTFAILLNFIQVMVTITLGLIFLPFIKVSLPALFRGGEQVDSNRNR
ncbi:MAG: hypothetical protein AMJ42_05320 [Deltaproteobacteria bacterium DG_8]|nr:MAG: hypothetical protein AMJ42_05320 [Deltaproteobacteria bacterium DG_8]